MKSGKFLFAVAGFALAATTSGAFAADHTEYADFSHVATSKTRAEVRAELEQAYAQGQLNKNTEYSDFSQFASTRSRDDVRKEAMQAAKIDPVGTTYFGG